MSCFEIKGKMTARLPKSATHPVIAEFLKNFTVGVEWDVSFGADDSAFILGSAEPIPSDGEDYCLNVTPDGVAIAGSTYAGLMRGFVTLLSEIFCTGFEQYAIECKLEKATPKIGFRSVHICVFPETKLDFLRKVVRMSVMGKYSHLIIEFWGTLKMECFDLLGWKGAYTKAQIKEVFDEVRAFGVEIIPFFQHWGHASLSRGGASGKHVVLDQDIRYEYLYRPHSGGWVWDFKNPATLELLKAARDELCELCGEGEYFHIGCDEAEHLKTVEQAKEVAEHINTVAADLKLKGRRAIVWGDMLLCKSDFKPGNQYDCNSSADVANALVDALSRDIIIADWQYDVTEGLIETSKRFKDKGFDVLCCPFDKRTNTALCVDSVVEYGLYGFMKTTWHTLHSSLLIQVLQSGWGSYEGKYDPGYRPFSAMVDRGAGILRKLSPSGGEYLKSGWKEEQINI
ncbi:MAG: family 20 glycosylhydrolase [Clostridia bacterium]|nr:family 20 glycosylhydrolase [Clostridia bacterium]